MSREYPKQIFCVWEKGRCLNAAMDLRCSLDEGDQSPLEMHDDTSKFILSILDKTMGTYIYVNAELVPFDIPIISENTKNAKQIKLQNQFNDNIEKIINKIDPAYIIRIPFGALYGLTPAQVLIKYKKGEKLLNQCKDNLNEKNYSNNLKVINAIDSAIKLYNEGKLLDENKIPELKKSQIEIFNSGFRNSIKYRTDMEICKQYKVSIKYLLNKIDCPWYIEIINISAPFKKKFDIKSGIDLKNIQTSKTLNIFLNDRDWFGCLHRLEKTVDMFEDYHFGSMFETALKYEKENIENWKNSKI